MFAELLQYMLSGLTIGAIYALAGLGFSIIYNASHVINFAQGEFIMIGGMASATLTASGVPLPLAILIGCGGARTQEEGARQVQDWFEKEGWETRLAFIDEYYVHIDLMVVPIAEKLTAVCLTCTEPGIVDWLKGKGHEIIDVPFQDTMARGCNFMSLGKDRVIAPTSSKTLIGQLKARGFEVAAVDMSEISKTGGGIHCITQQQPAGR